MKVADHDEEVLTPREKSESPKKSESRTFSIGAERSYVAAILNKNELIETALEDDIEMISSKEYRAIISGIIYLYNQGWTDVSKETIANLADRVPEVADTLMKMGGIDFLERICGYEMALVNFTKTRETLKELHKTRKYVEGMKRQAAEIEAMAEQEGTTASDLIKHAEISMTEISAKVYSKPSFRVVTHDPDEYIARHQREVDEGRTFKGILSNMRAYDEMTGGFGNGRLHVVGAPTGCGKSLMSVNWEISVAYGIEPGDPTAKVGVIDTGELMYEQDWESRFFACMSGVPTKMIQKRTYLKNPGFKQDLYDAVKRTKINPVLWEQMADFDGPAVRSFIKRWVKRDGVQIIFFDNIKVNAQWGGGKDVYNKIGDLSNYLKDAAVECDIPVVAFIQLGADSTVTGRAKIGMKKPHISMFAGGQRTLHNTDVGAVMDWEDPEDWANDNRLFYIQKDRNNRTHRKDEAMVCHGDLRRARLTIVENRIDGPLDNDGDGPFVATTVVEHEENTPDDIREAYQASVEKIILDPEPKRKAPRFNRPKAS